VFAARKLQTSRLPSRKEIAEVAHYYVQRHGDGALRRIGAEMHRWRVYQAASAAAKWPIWSSYALTKAGRAVARAT